MRDEELVAVFDQQAAGYDARWQKLAPIRDGLHLVVEALFAELRAEARMVCVGVGTGAELVRLAQRFPQWTFTAVDPSGAMIEVCRRRAEDAGVAQRCLFHHGYLDSLPLDDGYDAATSFLVSQFIVDTDGRSRFFAAIAARLRSGGVLASSDLASQDDAASDETLLAAWLKMMNADASSEALERMRAAYTKDVAVLPPATVASIIESGGFERPVQFFQAGLLHGWFARRSSQGRP